MSTTDQHVSIGPLVSRVQYFFSEAPVGLIEEAVIRAARELTSKRLYEMEIDLTDDLQDCENVYDMTRDLPMGMRIDGIVDVDWCGCCLPFVDPHCNPCPYGWYRCGDSIAIYPVPQSIGKDAYLKLRVQLQPALGACTLPRDMVEEYSDLIVDYAKAVVADAPSDVSWSDPRYAAVTKRTVKSEMRKARSSARKGDSRTGLRKARCPQWLA